MPQSSSNPKDLMKSAWDTLYAEDLDLLLEKVRAGREGGGVFRLFPRCHPNLPTHVAYADGLVVLTCPECKALVARIGVADRGLLH